MNLANLQSRLVEWLRGGPEGDVVVSSRVRLARNVEGAPFVAQASEKERARVESLLRDALMAPDVEPALHYVELQQLDQLLLDLLLERRLISSQHAEADWVRGVAFDEAERVSIMVNEEDHLRMQFMRGGLRLEEAWEEADRFDDALAERIAYGFSPEFGYLTACPTNVGTGLRAGVMLHLPGLAMLQQMQRVIELSETNNLALRGVYGEGTHGAGDFYQISNQVTLGVSEDEILDSVTDAARELVVMEREAREDLRANHREEFRGRILRAFRLLSSASAISSEETLSLLSQVKLGVELEVLDRTRPETVNDLLLLTLPAHLQTMNGRLLDTSVRNELRADYVKEKLASS
ncbi:MAG: ATP--guanido phosphotransferase [Candidatus Brocadiia bacterium]